MPSSVNILRGTDEFSKLYSLKMNLFYTNGKQVKIHHISIHANLFFSTFYTFLHIYVIVLIPERCNDHKQLLQIYPHLPYTSLSDTNFNTMSSPQLIAFIMIYNSQSVATIPDTNFINECSNLDN